MTTRRLYYDDSYLREFDADVVSCEKGVHRDGRATFEVILEETAFYPTSGGQPHDLGRLDDAEVLDVRDDGDEIVHIVDRGFQRGKVHGCIHWARRLDHMQQHTGQHLLSAIFQERFGLATVSFHLGSEVSTIDLRGAEPSEAVLEGAERAANEVIFDDDRPVTVRYGTAEKLAQLGVRKEVERTGILRAIEIEGVDLQPCGGTHVRKTSQIGVTLVRRCSKIRQDWRVEFVCGRRTEKVARADAKLLRGVAEKLNCASEDVAEAAGRVVNERDAHFKNAKVALQRLAEAEAALTLQREPVASGLRVVTRLFQGEGDAEYLGAYAAALAKAEGTVALLARTPCGHLFFAQHPSAGKDMNALLKQIGEEFGAKGGGTKDFARGKLNDAALGEKALARARALVEGK